MEKQKETLNQQFAELIEHSGLSDVQVAHKLGVHPTTVWKWRKGVHPITRVYLKEARAVCRNSAK